MLLFPHCPACRGAAWRVLGEETYRSADAAVKSRYVQRRYRVLFETWFPGEDAVRIESIFCEQCGLIIYRPRPESADLTAKYHRLLELTAADQRSGAVDHRVEAARSEEVYRHAERMSGRALANSAVLDYGGGNGCLMQSFQRRGCRCELVDFVDTPREGVRKVGDTLDDLPADSRYDCIVASHVFEHLTEPREILEKLSGHLQPDGVLYVEVPFEVWGKPPLLEEPVTHLNFFTPSSLRFLLEVSGFEVVACRLSTSLHPTNRRFGAIRAVARRPAGGRVVPQVPDLQEAEQFLSPDLLRRACRDFYWLGLIGSALRDHVRRLTRRLGAPLRKKRSNHET